MASHDFFKSLTINVNASVTFMNIGGDRYNDGFEAVVTAETDGSVSYSINTTADSLTAIYRATSVTKTPDEVVADIAEAIREWSGFVAPYKNAVEKFNAEHAEKTETATEAAPAKTEETTETEKSEKTEEPKAEEESKPETTQSSPIFSTPLR